ncbi:hypothetical protein [Methylobacterium nigriterrae]|uniref:hypothetical protein n=1 Tax=Methylobacterium nigriterrae TaxID=3127512 RepID=UPI003013E663
MNPVAAAVMLGIVVAWLSALALILYLQYRFGLAIFALVTIAAFVRWGRLG